MFSMWAAAFDQAYSHGLRTILARRGVGLYVLHRLKQVAVAHRAGVEAILPEVAAAFVHAVDVLRIKKMRPADSLSKCFCVAGNDDELYAKHTGASPSLACSEKLIFRF